MAIENDTSHRLTTKEISENSAAVLKGAASDPELWKEWLATVAFHHNESANNCAAIMASPYQDKRELRNQAAWAEQGGVVREGETGIPLVHRSKSGNFFVDVVFPGEAIDGANEHRYRGFPVKVDLEDEVDGPAYSVAMDKWSDDITAASRNALYALAVRHGLDTSIEPELPSPEIIADAKALAKYCNVLKKEASDLIFKVDATFEAARRDIMNPKIADPAPVATQGEPVVSAGYEPVAHEPDQPEPQSFDASAHTASPSSIYSMASKIASAASADEGPKQSVGQAQ